MGRQNSWPRSGVKWRGGGGGGDDGSKKWLVVVVVRFEVSGPSITMEGPSKHSLRPGLLVAHPPRTPAQPGLAEVDCPAQSWKAPPS